MQPCTSTVMLSVFAASLLCVLAASLLSGDAQPVFHDTLTAAKRFRVTFENQTMPGSIGRRLEEKAIGKLGRCPKASEWASCKTNAECLKTVSITGNSDGAVRGQTAFTGAEADEAETKGLHEGFDKVIQQVDGDKGMLGNTAHNLFNDADKMKDAGFNGACLAVPGLMHKSLEQAVGRFMLGILLGVGCIVFVTGTLVLGAFKKMKSNDGVKPQEWLAGCGGWSVCVVLCLALPFILVGMPSKIKEDAVCSVTVKVCEAVKSACDICWAKDPCTNPCQK